MSATSGTQVYNTTTTGATYTLEIYGGSPKKVVFEQINAKGVNATWHQANGSLVKFDLTDATSPASGSTYATSGVTYDRATRKITVSDSDLVTNGADWAITCFHG